MRALRQRLSYANFMATIAVFIALGGTSWAVTQLPRNSVGATQIRSRAVGPSELRSRAVSSRSIRDATIGVRDLSRQARSTLRGVKGDAGPAGPAGASGITFHAALNAAGVRVRGNSVGGGSSAPGIYTVEFSRDVSACEAVASLASVPGGTVVDPPAGRITVRPNGSRVEVRTFDENGAVRDLPFNVIVAC